MIGVAFALHETFGVANGTERIAFGRVVRRLAVERRLHTESTVVERIARIDDAALSSPAALGEAFSSVFASAALPAEDAVRLEALFRMAAADAVEERFVAFDDVAPALRKLAEMNVPRVALSGGWPAIDQRKADMVGFEGPLIFAQDLGVGARTPAAFARVAETLQLPADRIWFVGSDARNEILPAAAAGLRTIWVNRDAAEFPAGRPAPDATVAALDELFDVLKEPYTRGLLALRHIMRTALDWRPGHFIPGDGSP
jgi:FMN phosphatase YigB (HAD superfamily)